MLFFSYYGSEYRTNPAVKKDMDAFNREFWAALALIGAFIALGVVVGKLFWAMWFLVLIAAFSQYKILGQIFAERYLYPASIGLLAILAMLPEQTYWCLVGLYIMRAHMFIPVFENNRELYLNGTRLDPKEPSNWCNLSDWYLMIDRELTLAGHYIQRNIQVCPKDYKPYVNFASLWRMLKNHPAAYDNIKKAKEAATGCASVYVHSIIDRQTLWIEREMRGEPAITPDELKAMEAASGKKA